MSRLGDGYVTTGDEISTEAGFICGHGALVRDGKLVATVSGFIERVNKLVSVRAISVRYGGEIGDVVVGRIGEVADKRWRVDLNARQNAVLMLASIILPGGAQRRRTNEDSLQMRTFFQEDDLISAEVQNVLSDGAVSLHTRSLKYGKLENGQLVQVPCALIKRAKQHFHSLEFGVDLILGLNGYVWITATPAPVTATSSTNTNTTAASKKTATTTATTTSTGTTNTPAKTKEEERKEAASKTVINAEARERVCRVRNSILALAKMWLPIHVPTILEVYNESINLGLAAKALLDPSNIPTITQSAFARSK
jgi:exosome complex component RRP4